jgi:hypothetical protein
MLSSGVHDDVNAPDAFGDTPLMLSCIEGHVDIVRLLLAAAAPSIAVDARNAFGESALWQCLLRQTHNCIDVQKELIQAGANCNIRDADGDMTLLQHLAAHKCDDAIEQLLSAAPHNTVHLNAISSSENGFRALHFAARAAHVPSCTALLLYGCAVNVLDAALNTPLHVTRSIDVAVCLVRHGARLGLLNVAGRRADAHFSGSSSSSKALRRAALEWRSKKDMLSDDFVLTAPAWAAAEQKLAASAAVKAASTCCSICTAKLNGAQHVCRRCAARTCAACSTKRLCTKTDAGEHPQRCCDACYNVLTRYYLAQLSVTGNHKDVAQL